MKLLLFDIDGTILRCGPQVRTLFAAALDEICGEPVALDGLSFAGKTDPCIVHEVLSRSGRTPVEIAKTLEPLRRTYVRLLEAELRREKMRLLPGILPLLESLKTAPEVGVGLLTGNWEEGARIKLGRFELNRYFPFGAFGEDAGDRGGLPPVALSRAAAALGRSFRPDATIIIGDTPADVECAKLHGISVMAVATGGSPEEVLAASGADWVVPDLETGARVLAEEVLIGHPARSL